MTTTKRSWFKRAVSSLLAVMMVFGMGTVNAFAEGASTRAAGLPVKQVDVPVEDGVYYAEMELMNASMDSYSMGNVAFRGSTSYEQKQTSDTGYRPLVVVKDGKATAIVEFMPMGYLSMYGFMMELNSVETTLFNLAPVVENSVFTPATILAEHKTTSGTVVYDQFNDPDSEYVFDGSDPDSHTRPAGYGHDDILVNVADKAYLHILTVDVTPIVIGDSDAPASAEEFGYDNAAYVSVFVPVMFWISPRSGEQYARMEVDWTSLEKVEKPEENVQYQLYLAMQIEKGNYTDSSYQALQDCIAEMQDTLSNVWPSQDLEVSDAFPPVPVLNQKQFTDEENKTMAQKLISAMDALEEKGDKSSLNDLIDEADSKIETDYTPNSWAAFTEKLNAAKAVQKDEGAGVSDVSTAVNDLKTAMEELVKRADTSSLDTLIAQAKEIKNDGYSEASWKALQSAISNAEAIASNPNASQEEVKEKETALRNAIDVLSKDDGTLDKDNLPDGTYSVYGEMIKMNRVDKSMSNDAINHNIKLTVEDGQYYLTMDFHGLSYLNRFGYLAELSYYENGYSFGQYGSVEGTRELATVLSTQKNADGSDVVDEFNQAGGIYAGKLYPDQIKFPLVADALQDAEGYVPLHVFVPVMEDISDGTGDQDVLLKLDWSTLKTAEDSDFVPEENVDQSPAVDLTDKDTGVKVHAEKGVLPEGAQLAADPIVSGADYDRAAKSLLDVGKKFKLYDVRFMDADGNEVTPNGAVDISLPVTAGYNANNLAVYRMNDDGTKTLVKGTVENGYYTITVKTGAQYALVEKGSTITDAQNTQNVDTPKTGDPFDIGMIALLALASAGVIGVTLATRKRKSTEA